MIRSLVPVVVAALAGTVTAQETQIEKGKQVYTAQKCQVCHSIAGVGNKKGALD
ncbi:MAG: c-type cytochrome [Vicinamibacterales bacterium]